MTFICQVGHVNSHKLTCDFYEGGGYRCELTDVHEIHHIGVHTIEHALAGSGYSCDAIEESIQDQLDIW